LGTNRGRRNKWRSKHRAFYKTRMGNGISRPLRENYMPQRPEETVDHLNTMPRDKQKLNCLRLDKNESCSLILRITQRTCRSDSDISQLLMRIQNSSWPTWLQLTSQLCHTIGQGMGRHLLPGFTKSFLPHTLIHCAMVPDQTLQLPESCKWPTCTEGILSLCTSKVITKRILSNTSHNKTNLKYLKCNTYVLNTNVVFLST